MVSVFFYTQFLQVYNDMEPPQPRFISFSLVDQSPALGVLI